MCKIQKQPLGGQGKKELLNMHVQRIDLKSVRVVQYFSQIHIPSQVLCKNTNIASYVGKVSKGQYKGSLYIG